MHSEDNRSRLLAMQKQYGDTHYGRDARKGVDRPSEFFETAAVRIHTLMLEDLDPIFANSTPYRILTIGDGRGGIEARHLKRYGHHVVASDLCAQRLAKSKEYGYIDDYLELNAEALALADNSFDFTLAKETLHHLQRPYLGVYEMLRVARLGAILIEPPYRIPGTVWSCLRQAFRALFRREGTGGPTLLPRAYFEPSGNYVFRFNAYELTQCALGLGIPAIAFRFCHRISDKGYRHGHLKGKALEKWIKRKQWKQAWNDIVKGEQSRMNMCFVFFKSELDPALKSRLIAGGFYVPQLKKNPMLPQAA